MERLKPFIDALLKVGNLDVNQAKTLIYYCIMTWSRKPKIRPILNLNGESGTGKNGIKRQMFPWCRQPKWINARNKTEAQLRDDLEDTGTAFVEEADKTKDPKRCENWYQYRYDESGKNLTYKTLALTPKGHILAEGGTHNHCGYTVVHTQNAFQQIELERRTLRITIFKKSNRLYQQTDGLDAQILKEIAGEVDWDSRIPQEYSNSAWDVWLPFMRVAAQLKDDEFLKYAREQIELKTDEDDETKVFEPKGVVLSEVIPLCEVAFKEGNSRVPISSVRDALNGRGYPYIERQISQFAKELGFKIIYPHNKAHIRVESHDHLKHLLKKAGYNPIEVLEDSDAPLEHKMTLLNT